MSKADLHVHSSYSEHPSDWFLHRLGAGESYTDPFYIYKKMKQCGMDYVTITDHNRIDGAQLLKTKYPEDVFISVESTAYFPEDGCKVHILIYDITSSQFEQIQDKRADIYQLRDYLKEEDIVHSVAHATYSVNGMLKLEHLEKLLLLFDVFEGLNGGRNSINNESWTKLLENLSPEKIRQLQSKYGIEPYSETPWIKGITGGSDDHAGLFLGKTYTISAEDSLKGFLNSIKHKKTSVKGKHNDYKSLAFMVYKIAIEFSKSKSSIFENSFFKELTDLVYDGKPFSMKQRFRFNSRSRLQSKNASDGDEYVRKVFSELVNGLHKYHLESEPEVRFDYTYQKLSQLVDAYFNLLFKSIEKSLQKADLLKLLRNFSSSLPGIFLTFPFFSTVKVMFSSRKLISELEAEFGTADYSQHGDILWFTDTLTDLNGVSVSLQKVIKLAGSQDLPIKVVSSLLGDKELGKESKYLDLPVMHSFCLPYYDNQKLVIPSPLRSIDLINNLNPSKIIVSTPGPVGLLGLLIGRLFNIPVIGVYHTDFKAQLANIMKEQALSDTIGKAVTWAYNQMDEIFAPSQFYVDILAKRGIVPQKIKLLPRGVDFSVFQFHPAARENIRRKLALKEGFYLVYTGRISDDKHIDIILKTVQKINQSHPDVYLLVIGEGPQRKKYSDLYSSDNIIFTGKLERSLLPEYLSAADLFVFPSITDTFGMSVLEAQACELPALVTNTGGPQEIIEDGITGFVIPKLSVESWQEKVMQVYKSKTEDTQKFLKMKTACRNRALNTAGWDKFFDAFIN